MARDGGRPVYVYGLRTYPGYCVAAPEACQCAALIDLDLSKVSRTRTTIELENLLRCGLRAVGPVYG